MGLIKVGRAAKIVYGTYPAFEFRVAFPTVTVKDPLGVQYIGGQPNPSFVNPNAPTAGTISVAGTTVTLGAGDITSVAAVVAKILATAISGYTVSAKKDVITLVNNSAGPASAPTVSLGTATNILFVESRFTGGVAAPAGALDDILLFGRTPVTITLVSTGGSPPTVQPSNGTEEEQARGALTYGTALSFSSGVITLTTPVNYLRVTNGSGATQISLYITR